jgi:hypothetical protein
VTSALLFVALLVVVDLSYRRWTRRSVARRRVEPVIVLDEPDAAVVPLPTRAQAASDKRRSG